MISPMPTMLKLLIVLIFAFVVNLPFGYWRQGLKKLSVLWFLAIHLPILLVIPFRKAMGISYDAIPLYIVIPLVIAAAVIGQLVGGRFRKAL